MQFLSFSKKSREQGWFSTSNLTNHCNKWTAWNIHIDAWKVKEIAMNNSLSIGSVNSKYSVSVNVSNVLVL